MARLRRRGLRRRGLRRRGLRRRGRHGRSLGWTLAAALAGLVAVSVSGQQGQAPPGAGARMPSGGTSSYATAPPRATPAASAAPSPEPGSALAALRTLPVKGRAPKTGYDRDQFGQPWADVDRNGCDTRNDILRRDLTDLQVKPGTHGCVVAAGTLADPYTGLVIRFVRGGPSQVDIDHVVALSDAWQKGAQQWPPERRERFANDPANLLAVDAGANRAKGDGDAATWLPPRRGYRCAYVARQVAVKARYGAWVTAAERDAIARVLAGCPGQPLPR